MIWLDLGEAKTLNLFVFFSVIDRKVAETFGTITEPFRFGVMCLLSAKTLTNRLPYSRYSFCVSFPKITAVDLRKGPFHECHYVQTLTLPPWSSVCNANIASNAHTELFSSILKWPSLDYLSTNCTLTWGPLTHCRLLIFSGMKSVRFQLRVKRKETEMPLRVESESNVAGNLMYFTALWRL